MPLSWTYRLHTTESYAFVLAQDVMSMGTNEIVKRYAGLNTLADLQKNCKELLNVYEVCRNEKIRGKTQKVAGKRIKGKKYGGPLPDYSK